MEQKRSTGRLRELYFSRNTSNCCFLPGKNCIWHAKQTFSRLLVCGAPSGNRGKEQLENRTTRTAALDAHLAAMVLHDFLNHRKAQSDAFFLSITDKRLKETFANGLWDAGAVVLHTNLVCRLLLEKKKVRMTSLSTNRCAASSSARPTRPPATSTSTSAQRPISPPKRSIR